MRFSPSICLLSLLASAKRRDAPVWWLRDGRFRYESETAGKPGSDIQGLRRQRNYVINMTILPVKNLLWAILYFSVYAIICRDAADDFSPTFRYQATFKPLPHGATEQASALTSINKSMEDISRFTTHIEFASKCETGDTFRDRF